MNMRTMEDIKKSIQRCASFRAAVSFSGVEIENAGLAGYKVRRTVGPRRDEQMCPGSIAAATELVAAILAESGDLES